MHCSTRVLPCQRVSSTVARRGCSRRLCSIHASLAEGARVRVVKEVKVCHAPKLGDDFNLQGLEGKLEKDVSEYNGKQLSANLPYKVSFVVDKEGTPVKVIAHLASDELEAVS